MFNQFATNRPFESTGSNVKKHNNNVCEVSYKAILRGTWWGKRAMYKMLNSRFARRLIEFLCIILSLVNKFIPKSKTRILLFNSKEVYLNNYAIYRYLINNNYNNRYEIYYSMPNLINTLGTPPQNVHFLSGLLKTALIYLSSSTCFLDTGSIRIKPSRKQEVFNLWHGTPLKRIGFMSKTVDKSLPQNMMNAYSHILTSSENFNDIYLKSFNLKKEQIVVFGQPRLDSLFSSQNSMEKIGVNKLKYKKIIMWMTTYRRSYDGRLNHTSNSDWSETNLPIIVNMKEIVKLNRYLQESEVLLIIKIHQGSVFSEGALQSLTNILVIKDNDFIPLGCQLYEILSDCDALITDYSSVYFDYLLLDRPIGFIIDDIEDYNEQNGFVFENPLDYMPGHHIEKFTQLCKFVDDVINKNDIYQLDRKKVKNFSNKYQDEFNCKRVIDFSLNKGF